MTKDTKLVKDENSSGWLDILYKHSDRAVKACVWILVVMSVALIVITIFVANPPMKLKKISELDTAVESKIRTLVHAEGDSMLHVGGASVTGACQWNNCSLECKNASKIYKTVFQALLEAPCEEDLQLNIQSQQFPNLMLTNRWIPANKVIKELFISNGNFTHIRNEAFNCIDFTRTQVLMLLGINVPTLTNGVLLGLSKLLSLHVVGRVSQIDRCFFQPVQSSLIRLRLGAELTISGDKNIFGISYLPNMAALDLSDNIISGPLSRNFFTAVPNIKCLTLSNSKITSIDEDAFDDIADSLNLLDLSNNLLTSIDVRSIEQILAFGKVSMYLVGNEWFCNCDLKPLINLYDKYEDRFGDIPYCKGPPVFYGVLFTNVTFSVDCDAISEEDWSLETTPTDILKTESSSLITTRSSTLMAPTIEISTTEQINNHPSPFQMRCLSVLKLPSDEESSSSSEQMEYFLFAPPCHEFELILLKNNSVQVVVQDADMPINIVWFSDAMENFVYTIEGITVDYNCEAYTDPYLIVDNLQENSTYTFCLVPSGTYSITPFNCLPLHVPVRINDDDTIWISSDDKQFTVGIICLIFVCSMLLGGVVAFFGIKAYPDLLEGSRHVLVVKKSDQTCYVSTITEGEYMVKQTIKTNSLKKKCSLNKIPLPCSPIVPQFNTFSSLPPPVSPPPPPPPVLKKTEENPEESLPETEDHYEMPCTFSRTHECQLQCIPNKYAMSPLSPPPLPKRNSDIVLYSSNSELLPNRSHPKMSF